MTNSSWLIHWSAFCLMAIPLGELPAIAVDAELTAPVVAQAVPTTRLNRPTLKLGSQGQAVSELQAALKLLGYYTDVVDGVYRDSTAIAVTRFQQASGLKADGIAGPATWERLFPSLPSAQTLPPTSSSNPASSFPVPSSLQTPNSGSGVSITPTPPQISTRPSSASNLQQANPTTTNFPSPTNLQPTVVTLPILRKGMRGPAVAQLQERLRTLGVFTDAVDGVFGLKTQAAVKAVQQRFNLQADGIVGSATWSALLR
ncbi:MAG: peptidoglycan-binding protein [Coleofasciculus sp. Co-bin14]|nr:peptidoglycan-binding protein [Coleofasciculus sp. Co-bin14]